MEFSIIGIGTGNKLQLTKEAEKAIGESETIIATERIAESARGINENIKICKYSETVEKATEEKKERIGILVSGDSGFFSAGKILKEKLKKYGEVKIICGISSMQYFMSRIGKSYDDTFIMSMHARKKSILGAISYNEKVFTLTGGENTVEKILTEICENGLGKVKTYIGENLGSEKEKIPKGYAEDIKKEGYSELSVIYFENLEYVDRYRSLYDKDFIRGEIPMTKEEIRWISVNKLNIEPESICYDIGGGTGSVSFEMAKKAYLGQIYSIEKNKKAIELLKLNREKTKCKNVKIVEGIAPIILEELPKADIVFIGGSSGKFEEIIKAIKEKNENVRIVINCIAIESTSKAIEAMKKNNIENIEISTINSARGKKAGEYTLMMANNPVTIISGGGK